MTTNSNYNDDIKHHYRTLALACYEAIPGDAASGAILDMAKQHHLTKRDDLTAEWLRFRVYAVQKHKTLQQWIGKAAYYVLLSLDDWKPANDDQWFAMMANYIREQGGDQPSFDLLRSKLPTQLDHADGIKWLESCLNCVYAQQQPVVPIEENKLSTLNSLSQLPRSALVFKLLLGIQLISRSLSKVNHHTCDGVTYIDTRDLCKLLELDDYNKNALLSLRVMAEQGYLLRFAIDKNGKFTNSKKPVVLYYALAPHVQELFE